MKSICKESESRRLLLRRANGAVETDGGWVTDSSRIATVCVEHGKIAEAGLAWPAVE